jgi:hypothetical protein
MESHHDQISLRCDSIQVWRLLQYLEGRNLLVALIRDLSPFLDNAMRFALAQKKQNRCLLIRRFQRDIDAAFYG